MSNIQEKHIEALLRREVEKLGGKCLKWVSPNHSGVPDRICIVCGQVWFVELKKPKDSRIAALQRHFGNWLVGQRQNYVVVKTVVQVHDLIKRIIENETLPTETLPRRCP